MTDTPTPELRALAAGLFAAARAERPGPALGRRLALIPEPSAQGGTAQAPTSGRAPGKLRAVAWRLGLGFAAAALLAFRSTHWLSPRAIEISAEQPSNRSIPSELPAPLRELSEPQPSTPGRSAALEPEHGETAPRSAPDPPRPWHAPTARSLGRKASATSTPNLPERSLTTAPSRTALGAASTTPPGPVALPRSEPLSLRAELQLLESARSSLRAGDSQRALALLEQRAQARTGHALDAEATLLQIEALSATGKQGAASDLAVRFVRDNPNSALTDRAKSFVRTPAARLAEPRVP
jgi:hypothetical protein